MDRGGAKQQEIPFKQRKQALGSLHKPSSTLESFQPSNSKPALPIASLGSQTSSDAEIRASAFVITGDRENEAAETLLRGFDMDMRYGPCIGLSRLDRWKRADRLGLSPPVQVRELLESSSAAQDCLWEGRV